MTSALQACFARAVARAKRLWPVDGEQRDILFEATLDVPRLFVLVADAQRGGDGDWWFVQASGRQLDDFYDLIEALMSRTRNRRRLDQLEGMLATLSTAIDGF